MRYYIITIPDWEDYKKALGIEKGTIECLPGQRISINEEQKRLIDELGIEYTAGNQPK